MLFTHHGVVDDEGIIRLLDAIELKEGTHVLVTVADPDTLIALFRSPYLSKIPEERLREELDEDAAWAHLLKYRQS
jgi:predicted DNA-binding antitoxin AbrB/MazE fold protein